MFGFISDVVESVVDTADKAISDPIGTAVEAVTQPVTDTIDVLQGLTEGELRMKAALRLGTEAAASMAVAEIIEVLSEED